MAAHVFGGIQEITTWNKKNMDVLQQAPEAIRSIFSSGITTGGLTAIIANIVIRVKEEKD